MRSLTARSALRGLAASSRCVHRPSLGIASQVRTFSATVPKRNDDERQWSTPLAKQLAQAIEMTGPIPLASYMRMCLTGDVGGYYTGAIEEGRDQFGLKGDFVTSPEISQIFGELIGIWFVAEWMTQGRPKTGVELIEFGPGRGTLMDDMLRTISNFKDMADAIDTIYLVEASAELRIAQKNLLCGEDAQMTETEAGWHSYSKYGGRPIVWTQTKQGVPQGQDKTPFIVAHEFFDALPIHAFQVVSVAPSQAPSQPSPTAPSSRTKDTSKPTLQWRELVVSPTPPGSTHTTLATPPSQSHDTPVPDFQLTLSPTSTRHSQYVPESSPRYRTLKSQPGALIEVCPDASLYASDFAKRIGGTRSQPRGAALVLDYGPGDGSVPVNSLRGISRHRRVSPFAEPGRTDLSADVDFGAVAEAALSASDGVEVHGPVEQGVFLEAMGIRERAEVLVKALRERGPEGVKAADEVERAWKRLVSRAPDGMGKTYKVLAILPENDGRRRPVGFGGDVGA